jgi:hypothetical protein
VGADVAYGPRYPRAGRVGSPLGLLGPALLELAGEPALVVLDYHLPDFAEQSFANHVPCLLDHGVSRVGVGHGEDHAVALDHPHQIFGLLGGMDHRLVEHYVEAGLCKGARDGMVHVVRRDDAHEIDALFRRESGRLISVLTRILGPGNLDAKAKQSDEATLQDVAEVYATKYGWEVEIRDGAFYADGAPTAGDPPYEVYEVTPETIFGFSLDASVPSTRWQFA